MRIIHRKKKKDFFFPNMLQRSNEQNDYFDFLDNL